MSLTFRLQKELATNTNTAVSTTPHDVANTHIIVSGVRADVVTTRIGVSDIHRNMLKPSGDTRSQDRMVGSSIHPSLGDRLPLHRLTPGQRY